MAQLPAMNMFAAEFGTPMQGREHLAGIEQFIGIEYPPQRPLALNRKNALFAGSDDGGDNWAVIATLIENGKLSGINPHTWLTVTLGKLANGHPANAVGELMPWTAVA